MSARRRSSQRSQSRRGRVQRTSRPQQLERNPLKPTLQRTLGHTRGFYRPLMWRATPGSAYSTPCRSRRSTVAVRRAAPGVRPGGSRRLAQHLWGRQRCSRQPRCRGPPRGASDAYPIRSGRPLRGCDQRPCLLGYMPVAGPGPVFRNDPRGRVLLPEGRPTNAPRKSITMGREAAVESHARVIGSRTAP
jgi:hypothetical protein